MVGQGLPLARPQISSTEDGKSGDQACDTSEAPGKIGLGNRERGLPFKPVLESYGRMVEGQARKVRE